MIAADRLFEIIDLETEASEEKKIELSKDLIGNIFFDNVTFRYGTRTNVFEQLSFTIQKAQSTAIVGESGSGKSTILSLLQNLYPLKEGAIKIGDFDINYIDKKSLRQAIAVVPQHIDLFAGSIIENIAIGDIEPNIQKVVALSQLLGINEFIEKMPNNYYTHLSEQGVNLSGGERQRLAITRALYRNPEILILDEATSSLDPASELKVQQALQLFKQQGKTIIVIAHRLSTIKNCDNILVLHKGKLVEQGTHDSLMQLQNQYYGLWQYHVSQV